MRGCVSLVDVEQFTADEVRAAPGDRVLLLGDRPNCAEAFLVREGELVLRIGSDTRRLAQDTWAFVPAGAAYTLTVTGDEPTRFLHIRVPSSQPEHDTVVRRAGGAEGETITDRPGRRATVLVDADELIVSEFAYGPGERGAEPHIHRHHADAFLVVEGEFTFHTRDGSVVAPAESLLVFPPGVVHGFDNDSTANARCFNLHLPSSGFGEYLRGRNPDFDQHDPPPDGGADPASIVVVRVDV
jgi:mannose-6-phosphate isomerase-like protein (cupin superfamily)